ncbi:hypothetical protein OBP_007 [Pseudomonas phage OBP]|uniref:hypothetical protein n=1 Tax=Pseudomonas phage OBP TaxID=1124849 RepID=UPI000240D604|nr:hypothetical protein OBP_007 [Pseudomonas phage OBP]AEV89444.1 hypothetical protein OBP_007 [Pseudomonas phage OBP]
MSTFETNVNTNDTTVEWVVESKGDYLKGDCEISAVIKGTHGHTSWGWPDDESKIIVLSCNNQRSKPLPIDPRIIAAAESVALEIVNEKNAEQKVN